MINKNQYEINTPNQKNVSTSTNISKGAMVINHISRNYYNHTEDFWDELPSNLRVFEHISEFCSRLGENKNINILNKFIKITNRILSETNKNRNIANPLPQMNFYKEEDNSIGIEWTFVSFRIGFILDEPTDESSWYLVQVNGTDEEWKTGKLTNENMTQKIKDIITFVLENT